MKPVRLLRMGWRWVLLANLALGLMAQPVLVLVGELHAQGHLQAVSAGGSAASPVSERGAAAAQHRIQHLSLCCSHVAPAPDILVTIKQGGHHTPATPASTLPWMHERQIAPFRPPIVG